MPLLRALLSPPSPSPPPLPAATAAGAAAVVAETISPPPPPPPPPPDSSPPSSPHAPTPAPNPTPALAPPPEPVPIPTPAEPSSNDPTTPNSTTTPPPTQPFVATRVILVGNPGVGKSTILNSMVAAVVFPSGLSLGSGMTTRTKEHTLTTTTLTLSSSASSSATPPASVDAAPADTTNDNNTNPRTSTTLTTTTTYVDTPGLADVILGPTAAEQISLALSNTCSATATAHIKLLFVATLDAGRVRSPDVSTLSAVQTALRGAGVETNARLVVLLNMCASSTMCSTSDPAFVARIRAAFEKDGVPVAALHFIPLVPRAATATDVLVWPPRMFAAIVDQTPLLHVPPGARVVVRSTQHEGLGLTCEHTAAKEDTMLMRGRRSLHGMWRCAVIVVVIVSCSLLGLKISGSV